MDANSKTIISEERAKEILQQLLDYYDIELYATSDSDADTRQAKQIERRLVRGIMCGALELDDKDGRINVVQHLGRAIGSVDTLTYHEVSGKAKIGMSKGGKGEDYHGKLYGLLGALCNEGPMLFHSMSGVDLSRAESLGLLFLLV